MRAKYFGSLLGIVLASILFTACGTEAGSKEETAVESVQPTMSDDPVQEAEQEIEKVDVVKDFMDNLPDDSYYGCVLLQGLYAPYGWKLHEYQHGTAN